MLVNSQFLLQATYLVHLARQPNSTLTTMLLFNDNRTVKQARPIQTLEERLVSNLSMTKDQFYKAALQRKIGCDRTDVFDHHK